MEAVKAEIKGSSVTEGQRVSFVTNVIRPTGTVCITLAGVDTTRTEAQYVGHLKQDSVAVLNKASELMRTVGNTKMSREYYEMSGWLRKRSLENFLWIGCIEMAVRQALQHTVVVFAGPQYDADFVTIDMVVDRSFIKGRKESPGGKSSCVIGSKC